MLWASVANTAPAGFWAAYHLLRHPEALRAVRQEIRDVLESSGHKFSAGADLALSAQQLDEMILLGRKLAVSASAALVSAEPDFPRGPQKAPSMRACACPLRRLTSA